MECNVKMRYEGWQGMTCMEKANIYSLHSSNILCQIYFCCKYLNSEYTWCYCHEWLVWQMVAVRLCTEKGDICGSEIQKFSINLHSLETHPYWHISSVFGYRNWFITCRARGVKQYIICWPRKNFGFRNYFNFWIKELYFSLNFGVQYNKSFQKMK